MIVGALAPWYGCKRTLAARIVEVLGPHRAYWELFCGSLAALLAKPANSHETVCDLHGDLTNLAWVLQSPRWAELYDRCARAVVCEGLFDHACAVCREPCPSTGAATDAELERAYWFFVKSWWGRNGLVGAKGIGEGLAVRFTPGGGHGGIRFRSAVGSMPDWHQRLRSVLVLSRDALEVAADIQDVDGTAIYADPPYLVKSAAYVHDLKREDPGAADPLVRRYGDHGRLALALRRFERARVVVSYYAHPALAELYPDWTEVACPVPKALLQQGRRDRSTGSVQAPEVLLVNQAVESAGLFGDYE